MAPPTAILDGGNFRVAGNVKPLSSGASDIDIPHSLMLACFIAFITYNIAVSFDINLAGIVNLSTRIHQVLTNWAAIVHQHISNTQTPSGPQRMLLTVANFCTRIYNSSLNWIKTTDRSNMNAHAFRTGLKRMMSSPRVHLGRTILVDIITVPGTGSLALIRGLPCDVSAPEMRRLLETALFIQYSPQLQASLNRIMSRSAARRAVNHMVDRTVDRTVDRSELGNTEDAQINTSRPGLWNGTCLQSNTSTASTPSTSGINTRTSETSASSTPASGVNDPTSRVSTFTTGADFSVLALASSTQRLSHP